MKKLFFAGILASLCLADTAHATTYNVDWTFGEQQVAGTITTDGRTGVHDFTTVETWASVDITLTSPNLFGGGPVFVNAANLMQFVFNDLILTPTQIKFDFDGPTLFIAQNVIATAISAPLAQSGFCMTGASFPNLCIDGQPTRAASGFFEQNGFGNTITRLFQPFSGTHVIATAAPVTTPVPLPAAGLLLLAGVAGMFALRRT